MWRYDGAWELSYFGANVLHPRTTLPAMRYSIPITLRNYFNLDAPGTSISDNCIVPPADKPSGVGGSYAEIKDMVNYVKGLATIDDVCLINVEGTGMVGVPGTASSVFAALKEVNVNVVMISQVSALSERGGESGRAQRGLSGREWWTADGIQSYVVS